MSEICALFSASLINVKENIVFINKLLEKFNNQIRIIKTSEITLVISNTIKGSQKLYITDLSGNIIKKPKVVFCKLTSPDITFDKEIILLRHLELIGVKTINHSDGILNCINKFAHLQILSQNKIPVPKSACTTHSDLIEYIDHPLIKNKTIIKNVKGHRGQNVFLSDSVKMLKSICGSLKNDNPYISQRYIKYSHGMDSRVVVIDNKISGSIIRKAIDSKVQANISQGGSYEIVTGKFKQAEEIALKAVQVLKLDIASVDLLFKNKDEFLICEVNQNCKMSF